MEEEEGWREDKKEENEGKRQAQLQPLEKVNRSQTSKRGI